MPDLSGEQLGLGLCAPFVPGPDGGSDEWYTPQWLLDALPQPIDLDPCADPGRRVPAARHIVGQEGGDGLAEPWSGRVFCNPPYSAGNLPKWVAKCHAEALRGCEVIALIPVQTGSGYWWRHVWGHARVGFFEGRIAFGGADKAGTFCSALVIWPATAAGRWMPASIAGRRIAWFGRGRCRMLDTCAGCAYSPTWPPRGAGSRQMRGKISVSLDSETYERLRALAREQDRSVSREVERACRRHLEEAELDRGHGEAQGATAAGSRERREG